MITINPKYQIECDCCGFSTAMYTKKQIIKSWIIYQNFINGQVGHFCCENCARKYIHIEKLGIEFARVTKTKDVDGRCVSIITCNEERNFEKEKEDK